jgi:DNA-binding CsgD family transcriptional regulator
MADTVIGREAELAALDEFVADVATGSAAVLLEGAAGTGKTMLWKHTVAMAGERGCRVLGCRPAQAETALSYAALGDLLEGALDWALEVLPKPQAKALAIAMLRAETRGPPPEQRAVLLAALAALRAFSHVDPVLVAVDDVQWLDRPSAEALRFIVRRLGSERVGFLVAERVDGSADPLGLREAFRDGGLREVALGPLDASAFERLLRERVDAHLSPTAVRRLFGASGGNPFFGLELARALRDRAEPLSPDDPLPVPRSLRELLRERLDTLPAGVRQALLDVAALAQPTLELVYPPTVAAGVDAGVLELDGTRLRFTHPLVASILLADAAPEAKRALHRRLARKVADPEERARHLALGASGPDAEVAAALDEAARHAASRGAPGVAAELCELAIRVTPSDAPADLIRRRRSLARYLLVTRETDSARMVLEELANELPPGPERAGLLVELGPRRDDVDGCIELLQQALDEASGDDKCLAEVRGSLSQAFLVKGDLGRALAESRAALSAAERTGDGRTLAVTLAQAAGNETLAGEITPGLLERGLALEQVVEGIPAYMCPSRVFGLRLMFTGRFDEARVAFQRAYDRAADLGDDIARGGFLLHLAELELRTCNWTEASAHAAEGLAIVEQLGLDEARSALLWIQASVDAHLGRVDRARAAAEQGLSLSDSTGVGLYGVYNRSVLGFLELSLGDPKAADAWLRPLPARVDSLSWGEPSVYPLLADAIEALVGVGELEDAEAQLAPLEERSSRFGSTWGIPVSARCRGLLLAAEGDTAGAVAALEGALVAHQRLASSFERGRTVHALGVVLRRARKKRAAQASLEDAAQIFDALGARLWVERARAELGRIGGRAARPGALTPTEARVAQLVAAGRSNHEVATALFVSPKTVEWNLSKIYRKLHVRSRTELAAKLAKSSAPD